MIIKLKNNKQVDNEMRKCVFDVRRLEPEMKQKSFNSLVKNQDMLLLYNAKDEIKLA